MVQIVTVVATAAFVILLFVNEPAQPAAGAEGRHRRHRRGDLRHPLRLLSRRRRRRRFRAGARGGVVVGRVPRPADQDAVVANGRGSMPSFADSLTPEQIAAVVDYTRTGLG